MKELILIESLGENSSSGKKTSLANKAKVPFNRAIVFFAVLFTAVSSGFVMSPNAQAGIFDSIIDTAICPIQGVTDGIISPGTAVSSVGSRSNDAPSAISVEVDRTDASAGDPDPGPLTARQYVNGKSGAITYFSLYREGNELPASYGTGDDDTHGIVNSDLAGQKVEKGSWADGCTSAFSGAHMSTVLSNINLNIAGTIINFSGWLLDFAISPDSLYNPLVNSVATAITADGGLRDTLYTPFLIVVGLAIGIWVIVTVGFKGQASRGTAGAVWIFAAVIMGAVFMSMPTFIPNGVQTIVSMFSEAAFTVAATDTSDTSYVNNADDELLDSGEEDAIKVDSIASQVCKADLGDDLKNAGEVVKCSLWYNFVFEGWSLAQFGGTSKDVDQSWVDASGSNYTGSTESDTTVILGNGDAEEVQSLALSTFMASYPQDFRDENSADGAAKLAELTYGMQQAAADNPEFQQYFNNWMGGDPGGRLLSSMLSVLLAIFASIFIISASVVILLNMLLVLFLTLMMPLVFLVGIHPAGKPVVMQWANQIISIIVKVVGNIFVIVLGVTFYRIVLLSDMAWGIKTLVAILVTTMLLFFKDDILSMFKSITPQFDTSNGNQQLAGMFDKMSTPFDEEKARGAMGNVGRGLAAAGIGVGIGALAGGGKGALGHIMNKDMGAKATMGAIMKDTGAGAIQGAKGGYSEGKSAGASQSMFGGTGVINAGAKSALGMSSHDNYRDVAGASVKRNIDKGLDKLKEVRSKLAEKEAETLIGGENANQYRDDYNKAIASNDQQWFDKMSKQHFGGGAVLSPDLYNVVGYGKKDDDGNFVTISADDENAKRVGISKRKVDELKKAEVKRYLHGGALDDNGFVRFDDNVEHTVADVSKVLNSQDTLSYNQNIQEAKQLQAEYAKVKDARAGTAHAAKAEELKSQIDAKSAEVTRLEQKAVNRKLTLQQTNGRGGAADVMGREKIAAAQQDIAEAPKEKLSAVLGSGAGDAYEKREKNIKATKEVIKNLRQQAKDDPEVKSSPQWSKLMQDASNTYRKNSREMGYLLESYSNAKTMQEVRRVNASMPKVEAPVEPKQVGGSRPKRPGRRG